MVDLDIKRAKKLLNSAEHLFHEGDISEDMINKIESLL